MDADILLDTSSFTESEVESRSDMHIYHSQAQQDEEDTEKET